MFKKALLVGTVLALSSSLAFAGTPYVGGGLGVGGFKHQGGAIANIFGGYGSTFGASQNFYLGGELNFDVGHYTTYGTAYGLGVSILPGLMLSQSTMLYGRFGIDTIHSSYKQMNQGTTFGTEYGLGLQTNVYEKWDVRGEYVYSNAKSDGQYNLSLVYKFD